MPLPISSGARTRRPAARGRLAVTVLLLFLLAVLPALAALLPASVLWSPLAPAHADDAGGDGDGGGAAADGGSPGGGQPDRMAPDQVLFEAIALDLTRAQLAELQRLGYVLLERTPLPALQATLFRLREPPLLRRLGLEDALRRAGLDDRIHPNHRYRLAARACEGPHCQPFQSIGWPLQAGRCGAGATIGIVDTAVDREHPALRGARIETRSFLGDGRGLAHGTAVAALLVGNARSEHPGLVPGARLLAAEVFELDFMGQPRTQAHAIVRALDWLVARKVRVVNMSFAGPDNAVLLEAVRRTVRRNVAIVAAAGNDGPYAAPVYPAGWDETVAVTAVDSGLRPYRRANRGDYVEFSAPGVGIWTARPDGEGRFDDGTSLAAVFVSAALATQDPRARQSLAALRSRLARQARDLGERGRDPTYGHGLLQSSPRCRE